MVEELTAQFRVCKHIKQDGNRCNSPAMTGMNFCFHHIGGKVASLVREGSTWDASAQLDFPYPADREAIQHSLHLVAQALREGKIDPKTANTYIRIFRLEEQNLHRWEKKRKATGKTKMQPPAEAASAPVTNAVILSEASRASASRRTRIPSASASHSSKRRTRRTLCALRVLRGESFPTAPPQRPQTATPRRNPPRTLPTPPPPGL